MVTPAPSSIEPAVSLLMVARNAAAHIDAALVSARRQTLQAIEIVVVDDRSSDATGEIIRRHAAEDPRVIAVRGHGKGLAAVRNLSMAAAAAPFAAVVDSDDILHPRHAENLLALATRTGADLAASNMVTFSSEAAPTLFAAGPPWNAERMISHADFAEGGRLDQSVVQLGYLKPLFRLAALRRHGLAYDLRLTVGEDWDLVERALAAGLTYAWRPEPTYFYRRHAASTSFRWRRGDLVALIAAEGERLARGGSDALVAVRRARLSSLEDALAHLEAVELIKSGRIVRALPALLRRPHAFGIIGRSLREGLVRRVAAAARRKGGAASEAPAAVPLVLVCGTPSPGSAVAIAAALAETSGSEVRRLGRAELADPLSTARAGQGAAMVLLADEALADAAAYAIGDGALFVAPAGTRHPLVNHFIERHSCGDLLGLLPWSGQPDAGVAARGRAALASGMAA